MTNKIRVEKARCVGYTPYDWLVLSPGGYVINCFIHHSEALRDACKHFTFYNRKVGTNNG